MILLCSSVFFFFFFFFNDTATTEIYTLSLHDALPIFCRHCGPLEHGHQDGDCQQSTERHVRVSPWHGDRKSTRLNSSHSQISYAVFCLKKKKKVLHMRRFYTTDARAAQTPAQKALHKA